MLIADGPSAGGSAQLPAFPRGVGDPGWDQGHSPGSPGPLGSLCHHPAGAGTGWSRALLRGVLGVPQPRVTVTPLVSCRLTIF